MYANEIFDNWLFASNSIFELKSQFLGLLNWLQLFLGISEPSLPISDSETEAEAEAEAVEGVIFIGSESGSTWKLSPLPEVVEVMKVEV